MKALDKVYISSIFGVASTIDTKKEPMSEIDLDTNREAMRQNAGKMEVGKYEPINEVASMFNDFSDSMKKMHVELVALKNESLEARRNGNTKWYNQFKRRKR